MMRKLLLFVLLAALSVSSACALEAGDALHLLSGLYPAALNLADDEIWTYASTEDDGMWIFCMEGYDAQNNVHKGEFWYVSRDAIVSLGRGSHFEYWRMCEGDTEVFSSAVRKGDDWTAHAAILLDGIPYEMPEAEMLAAISGRNGCLYGMLEDGYSHEYAFLQVDGKELCELQAIEIDRAQLLSLDGAQAALDRFEEYEPDAKIISALYRSNGVVTLNVDRDLDGEIWHMHIWPSDGGLQLPYDSYRDALEWVCGEAKPLYGTGLRVIESVFPE